MSKKKATMTLKDFHGGSIPSDLPLPSAPGVIVRPTERSGFDRQAAWGNPIGRSDQRLRPGSAGAVRNFDDKTPFLSPSVHIGRNFDEDERKPLDGISGPRRTVSDESIRGLPSRLEPKMDTSAAERVGSRPVTAPVAQYSSSTVNSSYAARFNDVSIVGGNSRTFSSSTVSGYNSLTVGGNSGQPATGSYPNAWGLRKEAAVAKVPQSPTWSAPDAASKLAHASALEKVSSGRWHANQQMNLQTDIEVIKHQDSERGFIDRGINVYDKGDRFAPHVTSGVDGNDTALAWHAEKSLSFDDSVHGGAKDVTAYDRVRPPAHLEANERSFSVNGFQPLHSSTKLAGSELKPSTTSESSERPKLKLLPRTKPLENPESMSPIDNNKQVYQLPHGLAHMENHIEASSTVYHIKAEVAGYESASRVAERPKLNLKPRSQPLEQSDGNSESKRDVLFGGARPRELVLKERGIDDVVTDSYDVRPSPHRVKQEVTKTEKSAGLAVPYSEKTDNNVSDLRKGKSIDSRYSRVDAERTEAQRRNWRNENKRNGKEAEKHSHPQQQQNPPQQERPPSPETWRKPVEQPKPVSNDVSGVRYGKAASALELATAFSRSVSDPAIPERYPGQQAPNRGQMPFSRLTGPSPRPQINGY